MLDHHMDLTLPVPLGPAVHRPDLVAVHRVTFPSVEMNVSTIQRPEGAFVPDYESPSQVLDTHLGMNQVSDWMVNMFASIAVSLGPDVDRKDTIWSHPTSLPPSPLLTVLTSALDRDFAKAISTLALSSWAIDQDFSEINPNSIDHMRSIMAYQI